MSAAPPEPRPHWVVDDARPTFWWILLVVAPLVAILIAAPFVIHDGSLALAVVVGAGLALAVGLLVAFFRGPRLTVRGRG